MGEVLPVQSHEAYRGSGSMALPIPNLSTKWEMSGQHHTPAALPTGQEDGCFSN